MMLKATVIESTGSRYRLMDEDGAFIDARLRGKLRLEGRRTTNPVAVGDTVFYEEAPGGEIVVSGIAPRRNYIIRRASNLSKEAHVIAANLDQALIVVTLFAPTTRIEFIDRFLVTCEAYNIPAAIVLNKLDMASRMPEELDEFHDIYRKAGYRVIDISATGGAGMEELSETVRGKVTLLAGNSGVGKSTIIKALSPEADIRIGKISEHHLKGMHTTTFARMYPLDGGGAVIDTPGIKGFGLIDIEDSEVFRYFPDFLRYASGCQYYNCTHIHEPGCAVVEAIRNGKLSLSRYESYLKILEEDGKYRT